MLRKSLLFLALLIPIPAISAIVGHEAELSTPSQNLHALYINNILLVHVEATLHDPCYTIHGFWSGPEQPELTLQKCKRIDPACKHERERYTKWFMYPEWSYQEYVTVRVNNGVESQRVKVTTGVVSNRTEKRLDASVEGPPPGHNRSDDDTFLSDIAALGIETNQKLRTAFHQASAQVALIKRDWRRYWSKKGKLR